MPLGIQFSIERIVMQPTSLCNLNCSYCYLPERAKNAPMALVVAAGVARGVAKLNNSIELVWHAGEPLSCGLAHFSALVSYFEELRVTGTVIHAIQTNATLIDEKWCELFRAKGFRVGVSIDGPPWANARRVGWDSREAFEKIMRGIDHLKQAGVRFNIICVVSPKDLDKANELYDFFADLGCTSVGFNIEEQLGVHQLDRFSDGEAIVGFWQTLFKAWRRRPVVQVREFARILPALADLNSGLLLPPRTYDVFPSVAHNGDVVLLAPEFLTTKAPQYEDFIVGNVLSDDFLAIVERGQRARYVREFKAGVNRCKDGCEYFATCYGGQPGNKFFELGNLDGTETDFCRNSEKRLADAVLHELNLEKKGGDEKWSR